MTKAITVKVATPKVIKALEAKLEQIEKDYASQEVNEKKYQDSMDKWRKEIQKYALANVSKSENIRANYREWNKTLNVDFDLVVNASDFPQEPNRDFETLHHHQYKEMKEDISNALNILRMTDEETVNASTMKSIAKYL